MSQIIRVLQCTQCGMFQADIVKIVNNWQCKVCNTKQSLRREVFRGSGLACRQIVQKLNRENSGRLHNYTDDFFNLLADAEVDENYLYEEEAQVDENMLTSSKQKTNESGGLQCQNVQQNENMPSSSSSSSKRNLSPNQNEANTLKKNKWDAFL